MTHPELEKLLDELGIGSPAKTEQPAEPASPESPGLKPLVMSIGEFTVVETSILSAMWRRFGLSNVDAKKTNGISLMKYIADYSKPQVPVVVIIGRGASFRSFLQIMISAKYNGRKVHAVVADSVLESLARFYRSLFARLISYADRVVCFSSRESSHLSSGGITADVLYPIVDSVGSRHVQRDAPQPKLVCCVYRDGGEISTLLKAFSLVKNKYPRAELTILTDSCEVDIAKTSGVEVKPLNGCIDGFGDSFDISINLTSLSCGFLTFMMSQAAGIPTTATDFGDIRELATNGDNALICRLNDPVSLVETIFMLVERDRLRGQIVESAALCCNDYSFASLKDDWARFLGLSI